MEYWHFQMWLPEGRGGKEIDSMKLLKHNPPVIGTGEWPDSQCTNFKKKLQIGDIVCIKEGKRAIALCEIISDNFNDESLEKEFLHQNYRTVKVLDTNPPNKSFPQPQGTLNIAKNKNTPTWKFINNWYNSYKKKKTMNKLITVLKSNKNLILTGAPGTGKTYLAKQIALKYIVGKDDEKKLTKEERKLFIQHYGFVQFHPSYDYTDFVEGLRPIKTDEQNLGFEHKNGIFKEFCKRALEKNNEDNFDEIYEQFINDLSEQSLELKTPTYKRKFRVIANSNRSCFAIPDTETATQMSITKEMIRSYLLENKTIDWKPYTIPIGNYLKNKYNYKSAETSNSDKPYVFVIDEINRAEISKVFGELFFSIDPGYRGEKGKVQTQYTNLIEEGDPFKEGFYIPENVYIIGTMNDIDRSVESFDFAMRRRFAWKEIKASDRMSMIDEEFKKDEKLYNEKLIKEAKDRLIRLNNAIYNEADKQGIEGLNSSYYIGPAYFLKLKSYAGDDKPFDKLWEYHLEGLLREYLRGLPDVEGNIKVLKNAYNNVSNDNE